MAPWRPLGGLWRPWGALGRPRQIFERCCELFGIPFADPKSIKHVLTNLLKSNMSFDAYFELSGDPLSHFWDPFWRYLGVLFEVPSREARFEKS